MTIVCVCIVCNGALKGGGALEGTSHVKVKHLLKT